MSDTSSNAPYSWAMMDANVLARGFATPGILEAYTAVSIKPHQEALVFIDDQLKHLKEIGTHVLTGSLRVNIADAVRITSAGGTVHTSFSSAITIFDTRTRLLPTENLELRTADGSTLHIAFGGAYRIADVNRLVTNAVTLKPCGEEGVHELRLEDSFVQDVLEQIAQVASQELQRRALEAPSADEARRALLRGEVSEAILRSVNEVIRSTGFVLERFRPSLTEHTCPHCHRTLSAMEIRARRCGNAEVGCNRPLEVCPECGTIVSQEYAACPRCAAELQWCDRCRTFVQVEKGRFCIRCHTACYPLLPRELLQHY